jgi:hypothetical protein
VHVCACVRVGVCACTCACVCVCGCVCGLTIVLQLGAIKCYYSITDHITNTNNVVV